MNVIAINGSPRKTWNTASLLQKALDGAAAQGATTELVHLYELNFKGCTSCFACKQIGGQSEGRCVMRDEASPLLEKITSRADVLILGSPLYFGSASGEMRSFMERLMFAPFVYSRLPKSLFPRKIKSGFIYTMNVNEQVAQQRYQALFDYTETIMARLFGSAETFCCYDTRQMEDYSQVVMEYMNPAHKLVRHQEVFPQDCRRAFDLRRASGARLNRGR
jgi:multimeric flavodoxin WrbA